MAPGLPIHVFGCSKITLASVHSHDNAVSLPFALSDCLAGCWCCSAAAGGKKAVHIGAFPPLNLSRSASHLRSLILCTCLNTHQPLAGCRCCSAAAGGKEAVYVGAWSVSCGPDCSHTLCLHHGPPVGHVHLQEPVLHPAANSSSKPVDGAVGGTSGNCTEVGNGGGGEGVMLIGQW